MSHKATCARSPLSAASGDREAQYRLALLYEYPGERSVPRNGAAAREWMLKSAEQGYAPAQAMLGEMELGAAGDRGKAEMWATASG